MHRDSFSILRDVMRWRVALVLAVLLMVLMVALGVLNTTLGYRDTANLAWTILVAIAACLVMLLVLPRRIGGTIFFSVIAAVLVVTVAFGQFHDRPMQHWAYIFPPVLVFLLRARPALAGMVLFGAYVVVGGQLRVANMQAAADARHIDQATAQRLASRIAGNDPHASPLAKSVAQLSALGINTDSLFGDEDSDSL